MRRDPNLIRQLLLAIEGDRLAEFKKRSTRPSSEWDRNAVQHHIRILGDSGWVETHGQHGDGSFTIVELLAEGADILDQIREDDIWKKACLVVKAAGLEGSLHATIDACQMLNDTLMKERAARLN